MTKKQILSVGVILLFGCGTLVTKEKKSKIHSEQVKVEIPLSKRGDTSIIYKSWKQLVSELKLMSLENGYDSLQIRIWLSYGLLARQQMIVIKLQQNTWSGNLIEMISTTSYKDPQLIQKINTKKVVPKNGWENLIKKLIRLDIFILPNCDDIKGMDAAGGDLNIISFEIANPQLYRFYFYVQPDYYQDQFVEARKVQEILKLLENEFNFKMLENN